MAKLEYTICIDTNNRDTEIYPEANEFRYDLNISQDRIPVQQIYLGSIELPLPQWTVEPIWQNLYFDEGLRLLVNSGDQVSLRTFSVDIGDDTVDVIIPIWANSIIDVDDTDPTKPIFTTMLPHGLSLRSCWKDTDPIRLISTPLIDPAIIDLTATNPNLVIVSDTEFQLCNVVPVVWIDPGGIFGFLHAPRITDPAMLARIIQKGISETTNGVTFAYDSTTDLFSLTLPSNVDVMIINQGCNGLPTLLGFGFQSLCYESTDSIVCPVADSFAGVGQSPGIGPRVITGQQQFSCVSLIAITPGNYTAAGLGTEISMQFNRFWLDPGCDGMTMNHFIFSDSCGQCFDVIVPGGLWTPDTLAQFLTDQMNTLDPSTTYTVAWNMDSQQFCISSDGPCFGLEFDDPTNTMAWRLGFESICYRSGNDYKSTKVVHVPVMGCPNTLQPLTYPSNIYVPVIQTAQRRFQFSTCKPRPQTAVITDIGNGLIRATTTLSHGFQIEDVVTLTGPLPGFQVRVVQVEDAFNFRAEFGSLPLVGVNGLPICICSAEQAIFNFFMNPDIRERVLRPCILGFRPETVMWSVEGPTFFAPFVYWLDHPDYLLLQISDPQGSAYIQHDWKNDNLTNIFAKLVIYPAYRLERVYPMQKIMQGIQVVTYLDIAILNPWHDPYQLHGRNWSATLVFVVAQLTGAQLCY